MKKRMFIGTIVALFTFLNIAYAAENNAQKALAYLVVLSIAGASLFCAGWAIKRLMEHTKITLGGCIWVGTIIIATILFLSIFIF